MSRLTRKEMKRDEVFETLTSIMHWLGDNARNIMVGLGVFLLLILAAAAYYGYRQDREADAGEMLAEAVLVHAAPVGEEQAAAGTAEPFIDAASRNIRARELFEQVQADYSGTSAARIADVYLGEIAATEGSFSEARTHWEAFLARQKDDMLASTVQVNLMSLDRLEGHGDALLASLQADLDGTRSTLPADVLLYQLAITQEDQGDDSGAQATWARLAEEHPVSPFAAEARTRSGGDGLGAPTPFPGT